MTNPQPSSSQRPSDNVSRPPRRPGWGLIQDVRPTRQTPRSVAAVQPESRQQPVTLAVSHPLPPARAQIASRKQRLVRWSQKHGLVIAAPFIAIVSLRLSTLPAVGEGLIAAYGLLAVTRRIPSRISFWLATVVLVGIGIEFLLLPGAGQANNGALFVFLLLCIGLISSMLETRRMATRNKPSSVDNTTPPNTPKGLGLNRKHPSQKVPRNVAS